MTSFVLFSVLAFCLGVTVAEPGKGGVVEELVRTHDPESDVLDEPALDASRRAFSDAVRIDEHGQHEGRIVGSTAAAVLAGSA
jgi:hypothetical protein